MFWHGFKPQNQTLNPKPLTMTQVNETAVDAPDDEGKGENIMNSQSSLSAEAGYINYNFQQMCLNKTQPPVNVGSGHRTPPLLQTKP